MFAMICLSVVYLKFGEIGMKKRVCLIFYHRIVCYVFVFDSVCMFSMLLFAELN